MKRVGIMSMQRIANYGSFLQAYGLRRMLEELGAEVTFIDFHPGSCLAGQEDAKGGTARKVLQCLQVKAPLAQRVAYLAHKKTYHKRFDGLLGLTPEKKYDGEIDILMIGSDEVFNCTQGNPDIGYAKELFGWNCQVKKLVSYGASFGNTTIEKLRRYGIDEEVAGMLGRFRCLSVRDQNSFQVIHKLLNEEPKIHMDPALMYDFFGKCSEIPTCVPHSHYLLVYAYSGRISPEECEAIREYARVHKKEILCIGGVQAVGKFIDCSPFAVLAYFRQADCVVTDTFHGTILSVISGRRFAVLIRESADQVYGNREKLGDLLWRLELEERAADSPGCLSGILEMEVDYGRVDKIIRRERERTMEYLKEILDCSDEEDSGRDKDE